MDMDEAFIPYTRSDLNLPPKQESTREIYKEAIEDSPLMSLWRLFIMNFFGHRECVLTSANREADTSDRHLSPVRQLHSQIIVRY